MFVFRFYDGKYLKFLGKGATCPNKRHIEYWERNGATSLVTSNLRYLEECKTTDINEAELFATMQSARSSNCYRWGGTIHEVKVKVELV